MIISASSNVYIRFKFSSSFQTAYRETRKNIFYPLVIELSLDAKKTVSRVKNRVADVGYSPCTEKYFIYIAIKKSFLIVE